MTHEVGATLGATLAWGFVWGIRHALEADHVVAVSAIVTAHRSVWRSALVGAFWGIGHTAALLVAGLVLIGLKRQMPAGLAAGLEACVAAIIVALGVGVLLQLRRSATIHVHVHEHDGRPHAHLHVHARGHEHVHHHHGLPAWGLRPLAVGIVHGLAGSGAVTVLVMQSLRSVSDGLLYMVVFGAGTIAGMLLMSGVLSVPLALAAGRYERLHRGLCALAGMGSVAFGLYYGYSVWAAA